VGRAFLIFLVVVVGVWVLVNSLFTSDLERVEQNIERLVMRALEGGEDAAAEIMDAFAEDYRGTGMFELDRIERRLQRWVVPGKVNSLQTGDFKAVWAGSEIKVPIVALYADLDGWDVRMIISVTCARRGDTWKIVNVTRISWGR